jgi:hypothetical protein
VFGCHDLMVPTLQNHTNATAKICSTHKGRIPRSRSSSHRFYNNTRVSARVSKTVQGPETTALW